MKELLTARCYVDIVRITFELVKVVIGDNKIRMHASAETDRVYCSEVPGSPWPELHINYACRYLVVK